MKFSKIRSVKSPNRGTPLSAGIDFYVPQLFKNNIWENTFTQSMLTRLKELNKNNTCNITKNFITLMPGSKVLIPSGIRVNLEDINQELVTSTGNFKLPYGVMLTAHNKSGIGSKKGLDKLAEVVDQDYQGEIHISIANISNEIVEILPGDKLIQFILEPILLINPIEVHDSELFITKSERGNGGFGSTGS